MALRGPQRDIVRALRRAGARDADIRYYLETGTYPLMFAPTNDPIAAPQEPLAPPMPDDVGSEEEPDGDPERR